MNCVILNEINSHENETQTILALLFSAKHRLSKDFIKMARILVGNNVTIWSPKREQPTT